MTKDQLQQALTDLQLPGGVTVRVESDGRRLVGIIESPDFEGMDEAERQSLVWGHLLQRFGDEQLVQIEFLFTNTPQETRELAS